MGVEGQRVPERPLHAQIGAPLRGTKYDEPMSSLTSKNSVAARRTLGALLAVASVALLTGCGATGNDSPTRNIRQVTDGKDFESGAIKVRNLRIVVAADGSSSLVGTFINSGNSADALAALSVNGTTIKLSSSPLALAPNKPVIFGGDSANATAAISGVSLVAGTHATVVIRFASADAATSSVLVTTH